MTNAELKLKKEAKGFKITSNIGYKNGEQTIISYTLISPIGITPDLESSDNFIKQMYLYVNTLDYFQNATDA